MRASRAHAERRGSPKGCHSMGRCRGAPWRPGASAFWSAAAIAAGVPASPHRRGRAGVTGEGCDRADDAPAACLVAWRGAPEGCTARVAPLDIVRGAVGTGRGLRNNVKDGTPRRAPEVDLYGPVVPAHPGGCEKLCGSCSARVSRAMVEAATGLKGKQGCLPPQSPHHDFGLRSRQVMARTSSKRFKAVVAFPR